MFLFPHPTSCHIMPLQMTGFLPSTYKMGWRCGSLFLFSSNMQLKTLDCSRLFGFLIDTHHVVPSRKHRRTHREQHDHLLICFLMVLSLETEKMQRTLLWFYSLQSGFLVHFGFTTKWVSWNGSRKSVLDFSDCSGPLRANVLSTNIGS